MLKVPSLEDLSHAFVFVRCAKLILQRSLACCIIRILSPVPVTENDISSSPEQYSHMGLAPTREAFLLVSDKNLESRDDLGQRDRAVALPFLHRLNIVNVYHKILLLTLVMNFRLRSVSTGHFAGNSRRVRVSTWRYAQQSIQCDGLVREDCWRMKLKCYLFATPQVFA